VGRKTAIHRRPATSWLTIAGGGLSMLNLDRQLGE